MSLIIKKGDLFNSECQTIVNTVNCVGVMGKGIALEFKKRYPSMFNTYKKHCSSNALRPGSLYLWRSDTKWILNFPTKDHWRDKSEIKYLEDGLQKFVDTYKSKGITSIAFPQLGCANGGLNWNEVEPLMKKYLEDLDILVEIYIYN